MDEHSLNAYLNLIETLLTCPSGEEGEVLSANQELIDAHLVQTLIEVAENLTENGDKNSAIFLQSLANEIGDLVEKSLATKSEDYLTVLLEVLQAVSESQANPQVVYPLLLSNIDKLNTEFVEIITEWGTTVLAELLSEEAEFVASTLCNFGNLVQQFPLGSRADNLEIVIAAYKTTMIIFNPEKYPFEWAMTYINLGSAYIHRICGNRAKNIEEAISAFHFALTVITLASFPRDWATCQINLGRAYYNRIRGERGYNLENAIACYQKALQVYTRKNFPEQWASLQNSLGNAYGDRIMGNKAENVEKAIYCYQSALEIYTRQDFPEQWATTQNNLGAVYSSRIVADRSENLEKAIQCYQNALEVRSRKDFPQEWAATQNNLASFYSNRIRGDRAENLEMAIYCYQKALEVYTREAFPEDWAMTLNNLAIAYFNKINGNKAENIDTAIACYQLALQVRTRADFPEAWAMTQNNLAIAYKDKITGNRAENIDTAIACYQLALEVYTREDFPEDWAMTLNNLGSAYKDRITGNRAENIDTAIACYQLALEVRTRADFPEAWAMTQNNLGTAYSDKITGNRAENIDSAIRCFRLALEFRTPTTLPLDCLKSGRNLGNLAFKEGLWEIAIEGYETAINAVEKSRSWSTTDASRQQIIADSIDVYENIIQAYINSGNLEKAIAYVERSRAKRLVDLMASNDLYAGGEIPPQVQAYLQQHDELQAQIDAERKRLQSDSDSSKEKTDKTPVVLTRAALESATETIENLEAQKQQIWEKMRRLDPVLAGEIQVTPLDFATIQQLIEQPHTAILNFFTTDNDTHIFIIYKDKKPELHTCTGFGYQTLRDLVVDDWLIPYFNNKQDGIWYAKISDFLQQLAEKMQLKTLVQTNLSGLEELIIIPHLYWHQIPFAALPLAVPTQVNSQPPENQSSGMIRQAIEIFTRLEKKENKTITNVSKPSESEIISTQYLGDQFCLRYVPSSQILQYCQQRPPLSQINYGTVENPDNSLPNAEFECEKIAKLYNIPDHQRLKGIEQATISNFQELAKKVQVLHLSHHAVSRLDNPLESQLILSDGSITLGQLLTPGWRLPNLSDVFLSSCETNLGVSSITDDILTIATGFLCAGARSVVSTLWAVDDLATALFSIFYYQYRQQGLNRPEALRKAQDKLRNLPGKTLETDYKGELETNLQQQFEQAIQKLQKADKNRKRLFEGTPDYQRWDEEYKQWDAVSSRIFKVKESLKFLCRQDLPFATPYYWAGFICSGLS